MVGKGTSGGECYGTYDSTSGTGSGAGYVNGCIHSGSTEHSGGPTVWYHYVAASAGTIKNSSSSDTPGSNVIATESICPKGWTLPSKKQMDILGNSDGSSTYISSFSPSIAGWYYNGNLKNETDRGIYWGSDAPNGAKRYDITYNPTSNKIGVGSGGNYGRNKGHNIRCVSEEKDVSDLTYMQDMTPSVAVRTDGK